MESWLVVKNVEGKSAQAAAKKLAALHKEWLRIVSVHPEPQHTGVFRKGAAAVSILDQRPTWAKEKKKWIVVQNLFSN